MTAPIGGGNERFRLESHRHDGTFVAALPYRNLQSESFMGSQGGSLRGEVPFRGYKQVTAANLYAGIHELWLYDLSYSTSNPIFSGPLWDATPSSSTGTVSVAAQDPLSYLVKRLLKVTKVYTAQQPADMMIDLFNYTNGIRATNITTSKITSNAQTVTQTYKAGERNKILDLFDSISAMGDGVDYYARGNVLTFYGGLKNPSSSTKVLEYGGDLDGYSVQYNAEGICNDLDEISSDNGLIGHAADAGLQTTYDALYQESESSDLINITSLNNSAATRLKPQKQTLVIPSIVTKKYSPVMDFDFGDQFTIIIDDEYTQYNGLIRVKGWQITIGQGDNVTTVIYNNDTSAVL